MKVLQALGILKTGTPGNGDIPPVNETASGGTASLFDVNEYSFALMTLGYDVMYLPFILSTRLHVVSSGYNDQNARTQALPPTRQYNRPPARPHTHIYIIVRMTHC